jgi:hypothetical protein
MPGASISEVEVTHIDWHGLWLLVSEREYFLPYDEFPWFREARIADVLNVELLHGDHLHWPAMDVDLSLDCLEHPEQYPLVWR